MRGRSAAEQSTELVVAYEQMRANALGSVNRPCGLAVLLQHGMAAWICLMSSRETTPPASEGNGVDSALGDSASVDRSAAAVLADAILTIARTATGARQ